MTATVISITNQKGGVGKTTTAVNIATALASADKRILVVDLDPQGNTTTGFGIDQQERKLTIYDGFVGAAKLEDILVKTIIPNLHIITSNTNLVAAEIELANIKKREHILYTMLQDVINKYDYIFIDCPPSLGMLTINALVASDEVLIPMQCEFYALEGLSHLLKTVEIIRKSLNPRIQIGGILFTMYDKRNKLTEEVEKDVRNSLGNIVFKTIIPRNVRLSEAPSHGKPAMIYDHKCIGALAYMELAKEILSR